MQPGARTASKEKQGKPNKTKEISLDFLFSFGRIGSFQRVTANPNEKIPSRPQDPLWL
jgi:hypothetical protein